MEDFNKNTHLSHIFYKLIYDSLNNRNAPLAPYQLSICRATWKKKQHIDIVPTPSSFTGIFLFTSQVYSSLSVRVRVSEKWEKMILNIQQRLLEYYKTQGYIYLSAVTRHGGVSFIPALRKKRQRHEDLYVGG